RRWILSANFGFELSADLRQSHADRVRGRLEDRCDLARLETFPRPQAHERALVVFLLVARVVELDVGVAAPRRCLWCRRGRDFVHQPEPAVRASAVVGEALAGNAVAPGKWVVFGDHVASSPDREERVIEYVVRVLGRAATTQVSLERL